MAHIALLMDQNNKVKTPFQDAVAFMDGLHSRVVNYTTFKLWVHNPVICIYKAFPAWNVNLRNGEYNNVPYFGK